jgi:hypothetical protein
VADEGGDVLGGVEVKAGGVVALPKLLNVGCRVRRQAMGLACALEDAVEDCELLIGVAPGEPGGEPLCSAALDERGCDSLQAQIAEGGQQVRTQRRAVIDDRRGLQGTLAFPVA